MTFITVIHQRNIMTDNCYFTNYFPVHLLLSENHSSTRSSSNEMLGTTEDVPVRTTEHVWIPMADGVRLSARVWWSEGREPMPALLEYIPYRKRDLVRARDERNHPYFASHGYVCLRVDMRGSGDSEGQMTDMYSHEELADARTVINWIAKQTWCCGRVGMFGTSWGGTASLQAAVNAPPALKAVIANSATTHRFNDDIHWMGGGLLTDSFEWGATLPALLAAPPDSATVGAEWQKIWQQRLARLSFPLDAWISNSTGNQYWRHGSVHFSAAQLSCPILAIGGWSDRYSNSVLELVRRRADIGWGIVGPWGHHYPDQGEPGPAIGFQELALEWWDYWLKNDAHGTLNWPKLRIWQREFDPPQNRLTTRHGAWIEVDDVNQTNVTTLFLTADGLSSIPVEKSLTLAVPNNLRHGECAGDTGYFGRDGGLPLEQSADDVRSLCFDSAPLTKELVLSGHAEVCVEVLRDATEAQLVCRLCEVTPDGRSHLVVRQIRNLALTANLDRRLVSAPEQPVRYRIRMPAMAYRFARGNRIRLAFGTSYWPLVWPTNFTTQVRILLHRARLDVPRFIDVKPLSMPLPEVRKLPAQQNWEVVSAGPLQRTPAEIENQQVTMSWELPRVTYKFPDTQSEISIETSVRYRLHTAPPVQLKFQINYGIIIHRGDGTVQINSTLNTKSNETEMTVNAELSALWNDRMVVKKVWKHEYCPQSNEEYSHNHEDLER